MTLTERLPDEGVDGGSGDAAAPSRRLIGGVVALASVVVLVLVRAYLVRRWDLAACQFFHEPCPPGGAVRLVVNQLRGWQEWLPQHVALGVASVLCARGSRPPLLALPVTMFALWPLLVGADASSSPLLAPWASAFPGSMVALAIGAAVTTVLVCAPAVVLRRPMRWPESVRPSLVVLTAVGGLAIIVATRTSVTGFEIAGPAVAAIVVAFVLGEAGDRSGVLLGVALVVPVALSWGHGWHHAEPATAVLLLWPLAAFVLGAVAVRVERRVARSDPGPLALVLVVNVLNVVDALATQVALAAGTASEANPVVRAIGLPGKVVLVAVASVLIARWRPRALVVPVAALTLVAGWHVSGLLSLS